MRPCKRNILVVVLLLLVAGTALYLSHDNDPVFQGKRLSKHLEAFGANGISYGRVSDDGFVSVPGVTPHCSDQHAGEALEKVGTNALPMLVQMLKSQDTRLQRWIWETVDGQPLLKKVIPIKPTNAKFARRLQGLAALHKLGPRAAPAIPRIIPLLEDPDYALPAIAALISIHPERESDILSLTNVLRIQATSISGAPPELNYYAAFLGLSSFGPKARAATPILLSSMGSTNARVRGSAAMALARVGAPADQVVPLILADISKTNPPAWRPTIPPTAASIAQERQWMEDHQRINMEIWALAEYGAKAQQALPILSNLLSDPSRNVQGAAEEVIRKIKAHVKDQ